MGTAFKTLILFTVLLLRMEVVSAEGQPAFGPSNLPGSDEMTQKFLDSLAKDGIAVSTSCRLMGQELSYRDASGAIITGSCCEGLEFNARTNKCDVKEIVDPALVSCTTDSECGEKKACMPQQASHFFSGVAYNIDNNNSYDLSLRRDIMSAQVGEFSDLKNDGAFCNHANDCKSYSCNSHKKCVQKLVCRKADEGEVPPSGAECGTYLIRNPSTGKCEPNGTMDYVGLYGALGPNEIIQRLRSEQTETNNMCQFKMTDEAKIKSTVAIQSIRAMEWFLSSIALSVESRGSENIYNDCFDLARYLKLEVAKPFLNRRKEILADFTEGMREYEEDASKLEALAKEQEKVLSNFSKDNPDADTAVLANQKMTMHGEAITKLDLLTRLPSGFDALTLQYRRNLLFKHYEEGMLEIVLEAQKKIHELSDNLGKWNDGGGPWPLSDTYVAPYYNCRAHYEKYDWHDFDWDSRWKKSTASRWSAYYLVDGKKSKNIDIVSKDTVANTLALITGGLNMLSVDFLGNDGANLVGIDKDDLASAKSAAKDVKANAIEYFNRDHILLDPMLFGKSPSQWQDYGFPVKERSRGYSVSFGSLGGIGGERYTRYFYVNNGEGNYNYKKLYNDLRPGLLKHFKELKLDEKQTEFIYEPDLVTLKANRDFEAAGCFDNPGKAKCDDFNSYLDVVQDQAFAYFLAYSASTQGNYSNYFNRHTTWRRRLFGKLTVDLMNLSAFYDRVINYRDEQNACIKAATTNIEEGIMPTGSGGLQEGGVYYDPTSNVKTVNHLAGPKLDRLSQIRKRFESRFGGGSNRSMNTQVVGAGGGSSSNNAGAGSSSASSSLFSASGAGDRFKKMKESNDNATKLGRNVSEREKSLNESMKALADKTGHGGAFGGLSKTSGTGFGNINAGSPEVSNSGKTVIINNGSEAAGAGVGVGVNAGAAGGAGVLSEGKYGSGGYGMNSGAGSSSGSGSGNPTGLSDEESEKLMSEYERNKKEYKGSDEDGLFSKVSKAYIRNLDKVLKKKKVEP